jgi:CO/xanthine dehydrogenase Mo-binding subunit
MAADAVGVPFEKVETIYADSAFTENSGSVSASRMTFMAGNSIIGAAQAALQKWKEEERPAIATYQYKPDRTTPLDPQTGYSIPNFAYGYMAQAVRVDVDTETGQVYVRDVISTHDVGKAINPQQVEGQIEGAVVQALGYAVFENFIQKDGYVLTDKFSTYLIPGVLDIPERVKSIIMEFPAPNGPWGARGMAEMPLIPMAPAVIHAVHDATGVWFDEFPLTPERVLRGLGRIK